MNSQPLDLWKLYGDMLFCRLVEGVLQAWWEMGLVSGEMHMGTGEEAIMAGVAAHLRPEDALALDHRSTAAMLLKGVDPVAIMRECLGRPDGLCSGSGGHMHLMSRSHFSAASGIVGASGPAAVGFAMAGQRLRPGSMAVAYFGEGATNQGMLLESLNLAAAWKLPVLFVCKDNGWAISTQPDQATRGTPAERARAFGVKAVSGNGLDVEEVHRLAAQAFEHVRAGKGPYFLHLSCTHLEGHFLGDPLLRLQRHPARELGWIARPVIKGLLKRPGASPHKRWAGLKYVLSSMVDSFRQNRQLPDPLRITRHKLRHKPEKLANLEREIEGKVEYLMKRSVLETKEM
jgi:pyruvate dehydrogenase E1 component alpha subunit